MNKISPEILRKVEACKSPEELVKLAEENKVKLSLSDAKKFFDKKSGKLTEAELDKISGGMMDDPFTHPEDFIK